MACKVHTDPLDSLECVQEPDVAASKQNSTTEVEEEPPDKREGLKIPAMASDLDAAAHSPRTRVGKSLESIGDLTVGTLQRITTVVGGVVKSPVNLMAKVGSLASPRAASLRSPTSLEERVFHLEIQMKKLEEKFSSRTVVTELNLSPRSLPRSKEKPRIARSLLQEMETEGTLVKRVQMLEDRLNERMESIEKALSSIQSQLAHVDCSKCKAASLAVIQRQESLSGEEYHDAEQQSDNLEAIAALEQKSLEEIGEATGTSPPLVKEASAAAPTTSEPVESAQKLDAGKSGGVFVSLEPQSVESKEALVKEPVEAARGESVVQGDDGGTLPASSERQLASTLEELHEAFVTEPSAAAASARFSEIALADPAEKTSVALASSEPQSASIPEEPPEAAAPIANFEEPAQEDVADKTGTVIAAAKSPIFEEPQEDLVKEPLAAAKPAQEPATQEDLGGNSDMALASSEPQVASKFVEEPSASFEEPAQADAADKSGSMIAAAEPPLPPTFEEPQEDSVKQSLAASAKSLEPAQEDDSGNSAITFASSEAQLASNLEKPQEALVKEPSGTSGKLEEPAQENAAEKSGTMIAAGESPLAASLEETQEDSVKEPLAASAKSLEPAQEGDSGNSAITFASSEAQLASNLEKPLVKEPSGTSVKLEEPAQEHTAEKRGTVLPAAESPLTSTVGSVEEEGKHAQKEAEYKLAEDVKVPAEHIKSIEEAFPRSQSNLAHVDSDKLKPESLAAQDTLERQESEPSSEEFFDADQGNGNLEPSESVERKSFEEPGVGPDEPGEASGISLTAQKSVVKEPLVPAPSAEPAQEREQGPAQEPAQELEQEPAQEPAHEDPAGKNGVALASSEPQVASKFVEPQESLAEEPLVAVPSTKFEEPAQEPEQQSEQPSQEPSQEPAQEPKQQLARVPEQQSEKRPAQEPEQEPAQDDPAGKSGMALASSEPQVVSKFVEPRESLAEEPLVAVPSTKFEELAQEPEQQSEQQPSQEPSQEPAQEPSQQPAQAPEQQSEQQPAQEPAQESEQQPEQQPAQVPEQQSEQKPAQEPEQEPAQEDPAGKSGTVLASSEPQVASKFVEPQESFAEEPIVAVPSTKFEELAQEPEQQSEQRPSQEPSQEPAQEPEQQPAQVPEQQSEQQPPAQEPEQEPAQEDPAGKSGMALASSEPQVASKFVEPQESLAEESLAAVPSAKSAQPAQENAADESGTRHVAARDSPLTSKVEEPQNSTVGSTEESLSTNQESGNLEPVETLQHKSLAEVGVAADAPGEATGTSSTPQGALGKEPLTAAPTTAQLASTLEESKEAFVKEPMEAAPSSEPTESAQEGDDGQSGTVLASSEPQLTPTLQEPHEAFVKEPSAAAKLEEPVGKSDMALASSEPHLASKSMELQESLAEEPSVATPSAKLEALAQESVADKSSAGLAAAELPLTSIAEEPQTGSVSSLVEGKHGQNEADHKSTDDVKIPAGYVESIEESFPRSQSGLAHADSDKLKPAAAQDTTERQESLSGEEFRDADQGSVNFEPLEILEQKHVDEAGIGTDVPDEATGTSPTHREALAKETSAAAPTTEPVEPDAGKSDDVFVSSEPQLASTLQEPKESLEKEPSAAAAIAKLSELSEVEGVGTVLEDSPMTSTVEEPQKSLVQEPLAAVPSAKLQPAQEDHARKRRFLRSISEPQFIFKPEARKALAKESSAAASSAQFEEHVQEESVDMQCLPFRILGEGKQARKESEFKSAEDVKSPAKKPEEAASYVLEPKPSRNKEKKKKDKKDKRRDDTAEEQERSNSLRFDGKERRNSLRLEEKERRNSLRLEEKDWKNSLRLEEKDSNYSPRAEEKHKQPFKHWRDRLRHAFSVHKDNS